MKNLWVNELLYENITNTIGYKQSFINTNLLFSSTSNFQKIEIFSNPKFGKVLLLDDVVQTTIADEFFYHEMLVHVPLFSVANPKKVLIIGGGDGGALREALKHNIDQCYMVEIDNMVIEACKLHMPEINQGAFLDKRAKVLAADGIDFVKNTKEKFDVVIIDSTDPNPSSAVLFTKEFYNNVKNILNPNGVVVSQSGVPFFQPNELQGINAILKDVFNIVKIFVVPVPTYVGGFMCLSFASNNNNLNNPAPINLVSNNLAFLSNLKYYNSHIHTASFVLPNYIKKFL